MKRYQYFTALLTLEELAMVNGVDRTIIEHRIKTGWPVELAAEVKPYYRYRPNRTRDLIHGLIKRLNTEERHQKRPRAWPVRNTIGKINKLLYDS